MEFQIKMNKYEIYNQFYLEVVKYDSRHNVECVDILIFWQKSVSL